MGAQHAAPRHRTDREDQQNPEQQHTRRSGRPDTSVPQLVGVGLAAAAGMALASELHLYGTTAGAVVFAVATTAGAPLIQLVLHRAGDGCAALLRAGQARWRPHAGVRRTLAPVAIGALLLGAIAATGSVATAAPHPVPVERHQASPDGHVARDPAERGSTDKVTQVRQNGYKSAARKAS